MFFNLGQGDCSCLEFTEMYNSETFGNCKDSSRGRFCYVKEPSTCSDVKESLINDKKYSKKACKKGMSINQC